MPRLCHLLVVCGALGSYTARASEAQPVWQALVRVVANGTTPEFPTGIGYFGLFSEVKDFNGLLVPTFSDFSLDTGCVSVTSLSQAAPNASGPWLALVSRGSCPFVQKTETAVRAGAAGVIIVDNQVGASPPIMSGSTNLEEKAITIAVELSTGDQLLAGRSSDTTINVSITVGQEILVNPPAVDLSNWLFGHIIVFGILVVIMSFCVLSSYYCRTCIARRERRQAQQRVTNILDEIPTRRFVPDPELQARKDAKAAEAGDDDNQEDEMVLDDETPVCAICLGEFEVDEEIRTLPCKHEYHKECCDPWIRDNGTCPLCKQNILEAMKAKGAGKGRRRRRHHQSASAASVTASADDLDNADNSDDVAIPMEPRRSMRDVDHELAHPSPGSQRSNDSGASASSSSVLLHPGAQVV